MWLAEIIISVVLIVLSVVVYVGSSGMGGTLNKVDVGPAAFPRFALFLVVVFSAIQIVLSIKNRAQIMAGKKENDVVFLENKRTLFLAVILLLTYGLILPVAGFYVSSSTMIFLGMLVMGNRKWQQLVGVPLGVILFIHVVFVVFMKIQLP